MGEINQELELYKFVKAGEYECGWVNDEQFFIWPSFYQLEDFMRYVREIAGKTLFDDGGVEVTLMEDCVCIDLTGLLCGYDIELERVFPKEEFKH